MSNAAPIKILIVDDHAALRQTVRQMFDGPGMTILEATSGEEAVACYAVERPDWVVMDVRMPGLGGLRATEAICALDPRAQVIAISQSQGPDFAAAAQQAGAVRFVSKEELLLLSQFVHPRSSA